MSISIIHEHWEREVNKRYQKYKLNGDSIKYLHIAIPAYICGDGTKISIQAGLGYSCVGGVEFQHASDSFICNFSIWEVMFEHSSEPTCASTEDLLEYIKQRRYPTHNGVEI